MTRFFKLFVFACLAMSAAAIPAGAQTFAVSATGIPLNEPWKVKIYELARTKFIHPAWGWQHSERNYQIAMRLAQGDGLTVDTDVIFAAAFLHDMAAFMPCADTHMEHGDCAAQQSGAILRDAGFPMAKLPAVQAAERGHMYYSNPGPQPEAIVLHDADALDFLGTIGAARIIALIGEHGASVSKAVASLRTFLHDIPPRLITRTAKQLGAQRAAELQTLLDQLQAESFDGKAL